MKTLRAIRSLHKGIADRVTLGPRSQVEQKEQHAHPTSVRVCTPVFLQREFPTELLNFQ